MKFNEHPSYPSSKGGILTSPPLKPALDKVGDLGNIVILIII
jgi:hypothetical protein